MALPLFGLFFADFGCDSRAQPVPFVGKTLLGVPPWNLICFTLNVFGGVSNHRASPRQTVGRSTRPIGSIYDINFTAPPVEVAVAAPRKQMFYW